METSGSVSKGCFAFKGKKKRARIADYLPKSTAGGSDRQHEGFINMWESIDTQIQILQSDLNAKIFEDLLQFTKDSHSGLTLAADDSSKTPEIPTAALVTGVNTPDHSVMFANLVTMLHDRVTPLVAILKSKDCQNVKSILGKTLSQLLDNPDLADDDDEDVISSKNVPLTLSSLVTWYRNKFSEHKSSPKKQKTAGVEMLYPRKQKTADVEVLYPRVVMLYPRVEMLYPRVVIVFEDLESFLPRVLQDFVIISSKYISQLPLVFVFGIATSVSAVHRLLPNHVSSLLCMEKFQAPPSTDYLNLVINQILMTCTFPFKLGSKVFQLLLDIFLYHDFSVLNFIKGLRYAMLDHYFTTAASYLCCPLVDVADTVRRMDTASLEKVRQLQSFRTYVEGCPVEDQPELLINDSFTKERVVKLISHLHTYHKVFFPVLRCLHVLVAKLPKQPLGKQLRNVYSLALESSICDSEPYTHAKDLLKMMSKDELQQLVLQALFQLEDSNLTELEHATSCVHSLLSKFDTLDEAVEEDMDVDEEPETNLPSKTSLHQLRQKLQDISKRKKKLSPYEKLRNEVVDYFDSVFWKYLLCPKSLPLYEILYYDSATSIRRHLNAAPRSALQTALSNPQHYLQCECCKSTNSGQVTSSMPDVCITYKLHLECGPLINLYDWLQAFITVVSAEDEENDDTPAQPDRLLQARFIRAVSELQFLGFVKPTKRKTDHVARLTWGGC